MAKIIGYIFCILLAAFGVVMLVSDPGFIAGFKSLTPEKVMTGILWVIANLLTSTVLLFGLAMVFGPRLMRFKPVKAFFDVPALFLGYTHDDDVQAERELINKRNPEPEPALAVSGTMLCDPFGKVTLDHKITDGYHRYFVSFSYLSGDGCLEVGCNRPIRCYADVNALIQCIERVLMERGYKAERVVILHWQRFESDSPDGSRDDLPDEEKQKPISVLRLVA